MTLPLSGHGAKISRAPNATPQTFTEIAEVGDITLPGLDHNEFEAMSHNRNIDAYVMGILRRDLFSIKLNFLPSDSTHDHLTGLISAAITNPVPVDGFKIVFPDGVNEWIASGQVKSVNNIVLPVDGLSSADVGIRFSGYMWINGVLIGT
jgi:hypothetical protein